jgi:hypothetical protein
MCRHTRSEDTVADGREIAQVQLIGQHFRDRGEIAAHPAGWSSEDASLAFLYRPNTILVRAQDADRVIQALGSMDVGAERERPAPAQSEQQSAGADQREVRDLPVVGLVVAVPNRFEEGLIGLLRELAALVGVGVARPEHLLYVCGHPCPATEPEEVGQASTQPTTRFPKPPGGCCCCGHHCQCACADRSGDGGKQSTILIVDTGVDRETVSRTAWLTDVTGDQDPGVGGGTIGSYGGHGTFVAGCARVTAPKAAVHVSNALIPAIGAAYERDVVTVIEDELDHLERVVDQRMPDVLVYTFATRTFDDLGLTAFDSLYERRLRYRKDMAVLAPAGNDGWSYPMYPAAYSWVTSVGALDAACAARASYSNYGPWVDVWSPGTDVVNALGSGTYTCAEPPDKGTQRTFSGMARWSGTSFSTPLFAGMVAARASARSVSAAVALHELLECARRQSVPGIGPVLVPGA